MKGPQYKVMSHIQSTENTFLGMACFPTLSGHTQVHYMVSEGVQNPYLQPEDRTDFGGGGECHKVTRLV